MPAWSSEMVAYAKANRHLTRRELAAALSEKFRPISLCAVQTYCKTRGWKTGRDGRFQKGHKPAPGSGAKGPNRGTFKCGNIPANSVPVGTEAKETKNGYIKVKVAEPNTWVWKHVSVWEKANGTRPEGHAIIFIDADVNNCDLENLICVPRGVLARLNRWSDFKTLSPELRKTRILTALLEQRTQEKQVPAQCQ